MSQIVQPSPIKCIWDSDLSDEDQIDLSKYINNSNKTSTKPVFIISEDRLGVVFNPRSDNNYPDIPLKVKLDDSFGFILGNYIERATWDSSYLPNGSYIVFAVFGNERITSVYDWFNKYRITNDNRIFNSCSVGMLLNVYSPILLRVLRNMAHHRRKLRLPYFVKNSSLEFRTGLLDGLFHQDIFHHSKRRDNKEPFIKCSKLLCDEILSLILSVGKNGRVEPSEESLYNVYLNIH